MSTTQAISVVMPAFNEEGLLETTVLEAWNVLSLTKKDFEIIIVDDGSTDQTGEIADRLALEFKGVSVLHHEVNLGVGAALRTGFQRAKYPFITSLPADGQLDPSDVAAMLHAMQDADVVLTQTSSERGKTLYRHILSLGFAVLTYCLFGPIPRQTAGLMFRREVLSGISLQHDSLMLNTELIIKAYQRNFRFKIIPGHVRPRRSGSSKIANLSQIKQIFNDMVRFRFSNEYRGRESQ